jgi:hypothetical protein
MAMLVMAVAIAGNGDVATRRDMRKKRQNWRCVWKAAAARFHSRLDRAAGLWQGNNVID